MTIGYHEAMNELSPEAKEIHRALASLIEELEAVDWYNQRVDISSAEELKQVLLHNRNEEIEHACMVLEWLRRTIPEFDENLRTYLFSDKNILEIEEDEEGGSDEGQSNPGGSDLGIGKNQ
ncbi:hypothetical protein GF373_14415 [bacterium]|nr:hypothetical protein [bacterium]